VRLALEGTANRDRLDIMMTNHKRNGSKPPPIFVSPRDREAIIWRYMDFTKFVSMLSREALYFCRADLLGDPFEGSVPKMNIDSRERQTTKDNRTAGIAEKRPNLVKWSRQWTFINCWHMNDVESAAMWKLYSKSDEAIAIRSTFHRLDDCVGGTCQIGVVNYVDYEKETIPEGNLFYPYIHKRQSFSYENEIRAFIQDLPKKRDRFDYSAQPNEDGRWVKVNLGHLITKVFIAPTAPAWFKSLVQDVCIKYNFLKEVDQSSISGVPLY
jgi:hypothetical protein